MTATERSEGGSEQAFGSTRWEWRRVKINRAPQASSNSAPKALRWRKLPRLDWRKPITCTIKYRGGAEAWVEIHARGDIGRYPGSAAIVDILGDMTGNR
jgi:hypothetical protein